MKCNSKMALIILFLIEIVTVSGCGNKTLENEQLQPIEQEQNIEESPSARQEEHLVEDIVEVTADNEDLEAYSDILDCYYYELKSQQTYDDFEINAPFNTMATYAYSKDGYDKTRSLEYSGYGLVDINRDGVKELIIGNLSDDERLEKMIYLIATIHNNVPYGVLTSSETTNYYLCQNIKIGYESHGGDYRWSDSYGLYEFSEDGGSTDFIERVQSYKEENNQVIWKSEDVYGNETDISEEEANDRKKKYQEDRVQLALIPFFEYVPRYPEDEYDYYEGSTFGKGYSSWQEGYLAYLNENKPNSNVNPSYALINVDGDDIPELVCDTEFESEGCRILTYYDGQVNDLQTTRLHFTYIEKSGLLCNDGGFMGYYFDYVYSLEKGMWKLCFEGDYYEIDESYDNYDEETGRFHTLHYVVNGEELDEQTYLSRLNEVYDNEKAIEPESYFLIDDLMSYLKTGKIVSADHRYELVIEDCTWEEAAKKCEEKGGYLASMTCDEEFKVIDELIRSEGKQGYCFYIGAKRNGDRWWQWTEPGLTQVNCVGKGYWKHWSDNMPSIYEELADGTMIEEPYAEYIYRKSEDKFYINDVPNDVIALYPGYKGRMGYICEYNE